MSDACVEQCLDHSRVLRCAGREVCAIDHCVKRGGGALQSSCKVLVGDEGETGTFGGARWAGAAAKFQHTSRAFASMRWFVPDIF